jgi:hypothetical protein
MANKDILGTDKVRTKPEYTAKTHWAGSINFAAIFTAPVLYLILPILVLYVTGIFKLCANFITQLLNVTFSQHILALGLFVILWQFVLCWTVWRKHVKAYEDAPKYEYLFYNDIIEYKKASLPTPKIIKVLKFLINFIPTIVILAACGVGIFFLAQYISVSLPDAGTPGTGTGTPGTGDSGADAVVTVDWAALWGEISAVCSDIFNKCWAFLSDSNNLPIVVVGVLVLLVLIIIMIFTSIGSEAETKKTIKMKTLPARTLPAIISAVKKLPAPAYIVPDNCPRWLKKIIFWAPVRYNYGDVIINSPKGSDDDIILSKIEKPEELINYLTPIKPQPTEVVGYSANR